MMAKAPYVRIRDIQNKRVYDVRPTPKLLEAFPALVRETYDTKTEANERGYEWRRKYEAWLANDHVEVTVDDRSVESMVNSYKQSNAYINIKAESTKRSYLGHLRHVLEVVVSNTTFRRMLVSNVDYNYAQKLYQHIQSDVSTHKANHTVKVLKLVWNEALRSGKAKSNPFSLLKLPKLPDREVLWPDEHITGMIKFCDENGRPSMGTMITLLYELCQRVVDVRKLQWSNIDLDTDCFEFTQEKTGTRMSIPISPSIRKRLELHSISNNDNFILREESTGKPYTQDRAVKSFRRLAKDYGLPEVPIAGHRNEDGSQKYTSIWLNDLRRTGTTHASRAGCTDRELMALTGHKNPSMLVVYAKQGNIEAANAMKKRGIL